MMSFVLSCLFHGWRLRMNMKAYHPPARKWLANQQGGALTDPPARLGADRPATPMVLYRCSECAGTWTRPGAPAFMDHLGGVSLGLFVSCLRLVAEVKWQIWFWDIGLGLECTYLS